MTYAQRSTAAVITATLVGGAGIAAAVTGMTSASASTGTGSQHVARAVDSAQRRALSQALAGLDRNNRGLDSQLQAARRELARENRALAHERALMRAPVRSSTAQPSGGPSESAGGSGSGAPAQAGSDPAPPAPPTDTTTGASGGGGGDDDTPGDGPGDGSDIGGNNAPSDD